MIKVKLLKKAREKPPNRRESSQDRERGGDRHKTSSRNIKGDAIPQRMGVGAAKEHPPSLRGGCHNGFARLMGTRDTPKKL